MDDHAGRQLDLLAVHVPDHPHRCSRSPSRTTRLAEIYGANLWQRFVTVTWPNIKGAILVVVILRLAFNLAKIDQPFTLTGGGPGYETACSRS